MTAEERLFDLPVPIEAGESGGRPTSYDPDVVKQILLRVSEGEPLRRVLNDMRVSRSSMWEWRSRYPQIEKALSKAREYGEECIADECLDIADDLEEDPQSRWVRVRTRLALLEKWNPSRWGQKRQVNLSHDFTTILEEARARVVSDQ